MKKRSSILVFSRCLFFAAMILFSSIPLPASAIDKEFFQNNDIFYYGGDVAGCAAVGTPHSTPLDSPTLTGADNAEKIWNFLKSEGFSDEQAAGIMGNIKQESGFDPNLTESNGVGYGIIQWSYTRRDALEAAAAAKNIPVSDLGFQLAYLKQEASSPPLYNWRNLFSNFGVSADDNVWDSMKKMDTIERSTVFFHDSFERSGDYDNYGGIDHRIKYANEEYEKFTGKSAGSSSSGGANCSAVGSGDLIATLLEYAWPEYHEPPYLQMKPAYAEAVKRAQSEIPKRGVGGKQHPGIDCAGFVSLLIVDSGFDPEYNTKGTYAIVPLSDTSGEVDIGTPATGEAIQRRWMANNWTSLGKGGDINVADLQPGDVAVTRQGSGEHIFIHVDEVNGFGNIFASASLDQRAPMAGGTFENAADPNYDWFRKK